jgi:hypothetical protein
MQMYSMQGQANCASGVDAEGSGRRVGAIHFAIAPADFDPLKICNPPIHPM